MARYEIIALKSIDGLVSTDYENGCVKWRSDDKPKFNSIKSLLNAEEIMHTIHSVKRNSDGKVFSIGDKIVLDKWMQGRKYISIDNIYYNEHNQLSFSTDIGPAPKHFNFGLSDINCKNYTESGDFKTIYNNLLKMQEAKDKAYGNSALKPLKIFANHHDYGSRLDEKLARVQNSTVLRKNDVADIIGGLVLICKDKGWTNFDDLID